MLIVKTPQSNINERRYIIDVVMKLWLGLDYKLVPGNEPFTRISFNESKNSLIIPDTFFSNTGANWLSEASLPLVPLTRVRYEGSSAELLTDRLLPVIFGSNDPQLLPGQYKWQCRQPYFWQAEGTLYLGIDIFAAAFFMLTRCEEYIIKERDQHGRFPLSAALAYQEGFLKRPIINEYLEIFWQQLLSLWPGLKRKRHHFKTILSHDVDIPFAQLGIDISRLLLSCGADFLKRQSPILALKRFKAWQAVKKGDYKQDLNYTFDRLMDISEKNNLQSAFYFMSACTNQTYDQLYDISRPCFRQLFRDISDRGHEIGLHTSYETFDNPLQTKSEFHRLLQICAEEGICQSVWGGRQHFLRWQAVTTWRNWSAAGLNYDSTLTCPEHAGFRCGICYDYPVYDLEQCRGMSLIERPLIVMEESIMRQDLMGLKGSEIFDCMNSLKQNCRRYNGNFTLLWHNNTLPDAGIWKLYESLVSSDN